MKLLGVQIMHGYSSEARVFASLLAERANRYESLVIHHDSDVDTTSAGRFEEHCGAQIARIDTGWRKIAGGASPMEKAIQLLHFVGSLNRMAAIARKFRPDVVYSCQQHLDCWAATYVASKLKRPQIIHLHYVVGPWLRSQPLERLKTCDQVVTVSEFIRQNAIANGVHADRVRAILNPAPTLAQPPEGARANVREELGIPPNAIVIGNVSRIDPNKGHIDFIDAFELIAADVDSYLVIVGTGSIESDVREYALTRRFKDRIIFTGRRSDVSSLLEAFDIFVHPSLNEPCALALMEASLAGLPIVAYASGGTPEIVADGVSGLLTESGNVRALADSLIALARNQELSCRLGEAGRRYVSEICSPVKAGSIFADTVEALAAKSR